MHFMSFLIVGLLCFVSNSLMAQEHYKEYFETKPCWGDEFNYTGLPDASKWRIDVAQNPKKRKTFYIADARNVYVRDGNLRLKIRKSAGKFTSGRIQSKNIQVSLGRLDIRVKCPVTNGVWPALYLRGVERKPYFGEMDIMEYWGIYNAMFFQSNMHVWGNFSGKFHNHVMHPKKIRCDMTKYHVYSFLNFKDSIVILLDEKPVYLLNKKDEPLWPFDRASDIILALAYIGETDDDDKLPQTMYIDWVRYYRLKGTND